MDRVDISEMIGSIDFPEAVWEWLDLLGEIVGKTHAEATRQDETFFVDTPFKKLLLCAINKDLSSLISIYILLRCEFIHQASSHVRLLCESLVTLKYISLDPDSRSNLFWGYSDIEGYEIASSILHWESTTANPVSVRRLQALKETLSEAYEKAKKTYTFENKNRQKPFINWCNKSIASQASECGPQFRRLYELVYKQLSSYIHGSAWSFRKQVSYSRKHYQSDVVLNEVAAIVRIALAVWVEWAKFCTDVLDWRLTETIMNVPKILEELDARHFPQQ
jgi:hypothetical protein